MKTAIECAELFDGERVVGGRTLILEQGQIAELLPAGSALPPVDERYACAFVMPGLIDCHVHLTGYAEGSPAGAPFQPNKAFLRLLIYNGVTTARDVGNSLEAVAYMRKWSEKFHGPEVVSCGPVFDVPPLSWSFSRILDDEGAVAREVDLLALEGVDFIKAEPNLPPRTLAVLVQAASAAGLSVSCQPGATSALEAIDSGVASLEVLEAITASLAASESAGAPSPPLADTASADQLIERLRRRQPFVCPTLFASRRMGGLEEALEDAHLDLMVAIMPYHRFLLQMRQPFGKKEGLKRLRDYLGRSGAANGRERDERLQALDAWVRRLSLAGTRWVAGSGAPDTGVVPGFSLHQELQAMVAAGIDGLSVLRSATSEAAALLGREDLGVLRPGARADLLLLDADPTRSIDATQSIRHVFKAGQLVDRPKALSYVQAMLD